MRCAFCITGSQSQDGNSGEELADPLGPHFEAVQHEMCSVTIEGGEPTIHLPAALDLVARVPASLPIVWKTNAYASPEALGLLSGIPEVVLADYKFGNDRCAQRLANVPNYTDVTQMNLYWAATNSLLIVRHLLMPGHLECCFMPVARWMAEAMPTVALSLMTGFLPKFRSAEFPELAATPCRNEIHRAIEFAHELGLKLAPWHIDAPAVPPSTEATLSDELWIDKNGRICVGFASGALAQCLKRLSPELGMAV